MINIDQLLEKPIETLLAVFFNTNQNDDNNFEVKSNYKKSKFLQIPSNSHEQTTIQLSRKYGLDFQHINGTVIIATIVNNKNWNLDEFFNAVYETILFKLNRLPSNYLLDIEIALALFIFRGGVDFNRGLYSVDLRNITPSYIDNFFKLLLSSDQLLLLLNLNFRQLQPQFVARTNMRETQIRINLKWFYDNVIQNYNNINQYKTDILVENVSMLGEIRKSNGFYERLIFYRQSVLGHELTAEDVNNLRQELEFSLQIESIPDNRFIARNQKIASYARETFEDICVGCGDRYNIMDRSFKMPRNDRYYFEINHVIAYANDSSTVDVLDNLVKLCPTCHRALTPGRAHDILQKAIIEKMINSRVEVERFVKLMMPHTFLSPVEYVYSMLK